MGKAFAFACGLLLFLGRHVAIGATEYLLSEGFEGPGFENSGWTKLGDANEDFSGIALQGQESLNLIGHQQIFRPFVPKASGL